MGSLLSRLRKLENSILLGNEPIPPWSRKWWDWWKRSYREQYVSIVVDLVDEINDFPDYEGYVLHSYVHSNGKTYYRGLTGFPLGKPAPDFKGVVVE